MLTFAVILLRIVINPLANVFQKRICANGQSPLTTNFLTYFALSLIILPFVPKVFQADFSAEFWFYAGLVGLFGGLGNAFLVKAMQHGELSVLGPINAWKSVVGILFGILLLGEIPGVSGLFGIALIVAGSYFVLDVPISSFGFFRSLQSRPELFYRIAAMVLAAIEAIFIKKVILHSDPNTAFVVWCWGGAVVSSIPLVTMKKTDLSSEIKIARSHVLRYLGLVASVGLMQWATNYAFDRMPVGYALALFQLSSILSVFYGHLFFRETRIVWKLFASAVMVLGSVLIILAG